VLLPAGSHALRVTWLVVSAFRIKEQCLGFGVPRYASRHTRVLVRTWTVSGHLGLGVYQYERIWGLPLLYLVWFCVMRLEAMADGDLEVLASRGDGNSKPYTLLAGGSPQCHRRGELGREDLWIRRELSDDNLGGLRTRKRPVRVAVSDGAKPWVAVGEFLKAVPHFMAERKVCLCSVFPRSAKGSILQACAGAFE
jgi:hypothetical protein